MHLPLPQRRCLTAKLLTNDAFGHPTGEASFDRVRARAIEFINNEAYATLSSRRDARLDEFEVQTAEATEIVLRQIPSLAWCENGEGALSTLRAKARNLDCLACANAAGATICNGTVADDVTVSKGGKCLEAIKEIIDAAIRTALDYYNAYSSEFRSLPVSPRVCWSTSHQASGSFVSLQDCFVPVFVGAETRFRGQGISAFAEVILKFDVERFDVHTQETLAYVALHECFCHVFHGTAIDASERSQSMDFDYLAEGWLDGLVSQVFRDLLAGQGPAARFRSVLGRERQAWAGAELQHARCNSRVGASPFAPFIARARIVAANVSQTLASVLGEKEGRAAFFQLSLDLNVLLGSTSERNSLVNLLAVSLSETDLRVEKTRAALAQYATSRDARNFVARIREI